MKHLSDQQINSLRQNARSVVRELGLLNDAYFEVGVTLAERHLLRKVRKNQDWLLCCFWGVAVLFCAPTMLHNKFSAGRAEKERGFALSAIEEALKLSKAIEGFYESNDNQTAIIQS